MSFSLKCVQCIVTSVLRNQQYEYMLGIKVWSWTMVEKLLLMRNDLVVVAVLF